MSFAKRVNRVSYIFYLLISFIGGFLLSVVFGIATFVLVGPKWWSDHQLLLVLTIILFIVALMGLLAFFPILLSLARLHDVGVKGRMSLSLVILGTFFFGPILWIICSVLPGKVGANYYGEQPGPGLTSLKRIFGWGSL